MRVSIISLIYQSTTLADWVHQSVHAFTPMIGRGEAEFFFVANDPTPAVVDHLRTRGYQHVINWNVQYTNEQLFDLGYAGPEYMSRVYRGYNEGVRHARGDFVVLINSDNYFSPDWLENLLKYSDRSRVISCKLVERLHPTFTVFPGAMRGEFGATAESFDTAGFLDFVSRVKKTGLENGGVYMPALFHRDVAMAAGLFPAGNLAGGSFDEVAAYGDQAFFSVLASIGVTHHTALDSISYHLKEGERADEPVDAQGSAVPALDPPETFTPAERYPARAAVQRVFEAMPPTTRHAAILEGLLRDADPDPAATTLREILRTGLLTPDQAENARVELAAADARAAERTLAAQTDRVRSRIQRVLGPSLSRPAIRALRFIAPIVRPIRRRLAMRSLGRTATEAGRPRSS
jgi:hypothetical protein